ncbi:hypothetical protein [Novosphingobium sp.]|uniref:hypothetical protein n=1 Tax=Novosphingobium sp. TaxID=1874826 RepID=UPI002FDE301B
MISISSSNDHSAKTAGNARPSASNWLWRPWYAKLWWSAIPIWWAGMAVVSAFEPLSRFYDSAAAGFLNVLFFPITALMVLGVGYVRHWLDGFVQPGAATTADPVGTDSVRQRDFYRVDPSVDIFDPRSGTIYVGNPENETHG